jgi:exopolysaccharide biosynthesis predicted pyruvyltransferase EpsI
MADIWEEIAPQQRLSELLNLLKEQKEKEQEHDIRENAQEKKSADRAIQLAELIEILGKHMLELERRITELEKKNNP